MSNSLEERDNSGGQPQEQRWGRTSLVEAAQDVAHAHGKKIAGFAGLAACGAYALINVPEVIHNSGVLWEMGKGFVAGGTAIASARWASISERAYSKLGWSRDDKKLAIGLVAAGGLMLGGSVLARDDAPNTADNTTVDTVVYQAPPSSDVPQGAILNGYQYMPLQAGQCTLPVEFNEATPVEVKINFEHVLRDAGYDPGPADDGVIDDQTSLAVDNLQVAFGMTPEQATATRWGIDDCSEAAQKLGFPWWEQ